MTRGDEVPEPVDDLRTLQVGDPVRVVIESAVRSVDRHAVGIALDPDALSPWWYLAHDGGRSNVRVYRMPKPLPPELPPGTEVLDAEGHRWRRDDDDGAWLWRPVAPAEGEGLPWDVLLSVAGPVRELGEPIEAP